MGSVVAAPLVPARGNSAAIQAMANWIYSSMTRTTVRAGAFPLLQRGRAAAAITVPCALVACAIVATVRGSAADGRSCSWRSAPQLARTRHADRWEAAALGCGAPDPLLDGRAISANRGHYTSRVPFWNEVGAIISTAAIGFAVDTFLDVLVRARPMETADLAGWVLLVPALLAGRQAVRIGTRPVRVCWRLRTVIIGDPASLAAAEAGAAIRTGARLRGGRQRADGGGRRSRADRILARHRACAWRRIRRPGAG